MSVDERDPASRIADALADLADTFTGLREWMERAQAKDDAEEAERAEKNRRRGPAEWQAALDTFRDFIREVITENVTPDVAERAREQVSGDIVAELDRRLRDGYYGIRQALETLGERAPDDLRAIAADKCQDVPAEHREAAIEAFIRGMVHYERG